MALGDEQQGGPHPGRPRRAETVTRAAWGPQQLTGLHLGRLRAAAAAALLQPQAPPSSPIYKLGARSWELDLRLTPLCLPLRPPPPSRPAPPRLQPPPPQRAASLSSSPASSAASRSRRRRGALPPGLARAPDAVERALGREEAPPPRGSRAPPLRPRRGGQVEPPSARRPHPEADPAVLPSWPRAELATGSVRPRSRRVFQAENAAVIQRLLMGNILPGAYITEAPACPSRELHSKNPVLGHKDLGKNASGKSPSPCAHTPGSDV